jgi:hypothetical protein
LVKTGERTRLALFAVAGRSAARIRPSDMARKLRDNTELAVDIDGPAGTHS